MTTTDSQVDCDNCGEPFSEIQDRCPHCARPSLFPNVVAARRSVERKELESRYANACAELKRKGCDDVRQRFEAAVNSLSRVVIGTAFEEVVRLASSDSCVFPTYYQLVTAGLVVPKCEKWDVLRGVAEHALFPNYKDSIRFGAVSLDGAGVKNYGPAFVLLKPDMVHHRTSLYEDNNVVFNVYGKGTTMAEADQLEPGHRAVWEDRQRLCVSKLFSRIETGTCSNDFKSLVLEQGGTTQDDRFVEAHVWGSLTVRSIEHVSIVRKGNRPRMILINDLKAQLDKFGVTLSID